MPTDAKPRLLGGRRHVVTAFASQTTNTTTNIALAASVSNVTSPAEFGRWAIVFAAYGLASQWTRAAIVTPMLIYPRTSSARTPQDIADEALSTSLASGFVAIAVMAPLCWVLAPSHRLTASIVLCCLPLILLQDAARNWYIRDRRGSHALGLDLIWAAVQGVLMMTAIMADMASAASFSAAWAVGGALSGIATLIKVRRMPRPSDVVRYVIKQRRVSSRLLLENVFGSSLYFLLPPLLVLTASPSIAGVVRASQTMFGLTTFINAALMPIVVSAAASASRLSARSAWVLAGIPTAATVTASAAICGVALKYPYFGVLLTGNSWDSLKPVILPFAVAAAARGAIAGTAAVIRGQRQLRIAVWLSFATAVPMLLVPATVGLSGALNAVAWSIAATGFLAAAVCLIAFALLNWPGQGGRSR